MEVILGCQDIPAVLAERYGCINRALPVETLTSFVGQLVYRMASFPAEAIALAKTAVLATERATVDGLLEEARAFKRAVATEAAQRCVRRFLTAGGQTYTGELALEMLLER